MAIFTNKAYYQNFTKLTIVLIYFCTQILNAQNPDYLSNLDFYFNKTNEHYYVNKDSAYFYFNKIEKIASQNDDVISLMDGLISENWCANYHYDLAVISDNLVALDSIVNLYKKQIDTLPLKSYYLNTINYTKGLNNYELKKYDSALETFKKLVSNIETQPDFNQINHVLGLYVGANNFIGKMYSDEGKYELAKTFHNKNLRVLNANPESNIEFLNTTYVLISDVYKKEENYKLSNLTLQKVLDYYINITKNSNRIVSSYQNVIDNHINLKQTDSAYFYLRKMKVNLTKNHPFWYRYYIAKSNINKATKNYDEASVALDKALELVKAKWNNQPHNDVAIIYNKLGDLYSEIKKPNKAITNYNLAIYQFSKDTLNSTINQTTLFKSLKSKANILNHTKALDSVIATTNKALSVLEQLKPSFKNNTDKLFLIDNAFPVFESGLNALYNLYNKTNNTKFIDDAFAYAEKSKSIILIEALLNTKATAYANIPQNIIEQEQFLKSRITYLEKRIINKNTDALQDELFSTKSQYSNLILNLESNYKNYYDLKYNTAVVSAKQLQNTLKKDEIFISYFYGSQAIYAIGISKNKKNILKIPINNSFYKNLIVFQKNISNPKSNLETVAQQSHDLYLKLIAPILQEHNAKKIIIAADGFLNYIPFSALNTSKTNINYLIEDYGISYVNSATLLSQLQENQNTNNKIIAFAPTFKFEESNLLPLPNNKNEVEAILNHIKGEAFTGNQASLNNFTNKSLNYGIIHMATHAIFNDNNPEYSFLAFSPKPQSENLLYTKDLYNLKLNANLVTLSACDSGIGELKRGEGLLSLARGFYFSGAKSITSTLWKINDASASILMNDFYFALSKNKAKPKALQIAQVNFINNNRDNALSHPYYWSGFVISGNTKPISTTNYLWIWIIGSLVFIIALALFYFKNKKAN